MKKIIILGLLFTFVLSAGVASGRTFFSSENFTDQDQFEGWYADEVLNLKITGIINGYEDGSFRPNENITRAEMAVIIAKLNDRIDELEKKRVTGGDVANIITNYLSLKDHGFDDFSSEKLAIAASGVDLRDSLYNGVDVEEFLGASPCGVIDLDYEELNDEFTMIGCPGGGGSVIIYGESSYATSPNVDYINKTLYYELDEEKDFYIPDLFE